MLTARARLGAGYPNAGNGFELDVVAVVLGGATLFRGCAAMVQHLIGAMLLGVVSIVLNILGIFPFFLQMTTKGLPVFIVVIAGTRCLVRIGHPLRKD